MEHPMSEDRATPIEGCWVRRIGGGGVGQVIARQSEGKSHRVRVDWLDGSYDWLSTESVVSGFANGWAVQDIPASATRTSLGAGQIVGRRTIGGREQMLVQLDADGRSVWLPYENLRRIKNVRHRYERAEHHTEDHAERFRLRVLAHALESWNQLTGSLDRIDVDPLPHQIQLVHRILSSGNYNWLIADDVGLGKTIEVGLLLAALSRKRRSLRVLIVCPAGLVRQWQDELHFKFGLDDYLIYGRDFRVSVAAHWKQFEHVITSIDLAKRDDQYEMFRQGDGWDVVVFDEGHKLTRYASGERVQRYRFAEMLRPKADAFLLLSGTPHQGHTDKFIAILELVRPDLRSQLHTLTANPEIIAEVILRNRKSEVTDADGAFIFRGHVVHRVGIAPSPDSERLSKLLVDYVRRGYRAGERGGSEGRAIGFVMTTYRKLASSSVAAIDRALRRRRERLLGGADDAHGADGYETTEDLVEGGDDQDDLANAPAGPAEEFFEDEVEQIDALLAEAAVLRQNDQKLAALLDSVVAPVVADGKKLLVFTEYRATQEYLADALRTRFAGAGRVVLINGSMKLEEKLEAIDAFASDAAFLISTEAGGEGINLHRACHVMVNYDLPWNPARLVQRIGRLYRYGQTETVIVFNLHSRDTFDNAALDLMLGRVSQMAQDMAPVGADYHDRLYSEILGDLLDTIDFAAVLHSATSLDLERTKTEIDEALARAEQTKRLQDELFAHIPGYDPGALSGTLGLTLEHAASFVRGMLPRVGGEVSATLHGGEVLEIRLPEHLKGEFSEFGQRTVNRVTWTRRRAQELRDVILMDFESSFFRYLVALAQDEQFGGKYASIRAPDGAAGALLALELRWQNDQGDVISEEFTPLLRSADGSIVANPDFLPGWLGQPAEEASDRLDDFRLRKEAYSSLEEEAHRRLASGGSKFKHPNGMVPLAAADLIDAS